MGSGGRLLRAPHAKPPFTLGELKKAVPPHCFQRSIIRSLSYFISDLMFVSFFYYIATTYIPPLPDHRLTYLAWPIYWICQGSVLTGVWNLAHDCGHHAFSNYQWFDDALGLLIHSSLLVPYFSWKISHRRHHLNASSLERDEVFVPKPKDGRSAFNKFVDESPIIKIVLRVTVGWPMYLLFNISGRKYDTYTSHFYPYSPMFSDNERLQIVIGDLGFLAGLYAVYCAVAAKGLPWVMCVYGIPNAIVIGLLATITYLNHTHPSLPHYDSSEWDWLRGALSTVDRDYGILNPIVHHLTDTHVVHHLFPTMPHYHTTEATKAIKPILGEYYQFDGTPILKAIWRESNKCAYVEPDQDEKSKGVFWFNNKP